MRRTLGADSRSWALVMRGGSGPKSGSSDSRDVSRLDAFLRGGGTCPIAWCIALNFCRRFWNQTCTQRGVMSSRFESSRSRHWRGRGSVSKTRSRTESWVQEKFWRLRRFFFSAAVSGGPSSSSSGSSSAIICASGKRAVM